MGFGLELFILVLLIFLNGIFALSEIAVVSSRKARLQHLANKGSSRAKIALELANSPNHFLATVQGGITLVGILTGAFGGFALVEPVSGYFETLPYIAKYAHPLAIGFVVIGITYFSLIIGELLPKQLALKNPERIAMMIAIPMKTLSLIMFPLVKFLNFTTHSIFRVFRVKDSTEPLVTEEEIKVMIEQGTKTGMFNEVEQDMVENVFRLSDKRVNGLMTPRTEIIWLDAEEPIVENLKKITESSHSFFPVCKGTIDSMLGVVHVKDMLSRSIASQPLRLEECLRQPLFVVESMLAIQLIEQFKKTGIHIAILVDEYGGIQGLLTLNDILKAVVGNEIDEEEMGNPYIVKRADGSYLIDGALMLDEFKELFSIDEMSEDDTGNYQTVAGFVINQMGKIPSAGQFFKWRNLQIEVVDMDGNRIDKLLISQKTLQS